MKDALDLKIKKVAQNIRKIREYRNYTQEYLAAKLRISQNAYSKIELGHTKITIDRLLYIADVLGVDPIAILNIDDSEILSTVKSNSA
ncbi:MAG TPA: helix-turn-helix transcriptional regulator [Mucilaginibacter sp.]|jgi:transcriptional regulator with XRE-family HTH domain|nr:helix-turn-helix transcriptional regulator [Mucilaginibacter sp.]